MVFAGRLDGKFLGLSRSFDCKGEGIQMCNGFPFVTIFDIILKLIYLFMYSRVSSIITSPLHYLFSINKELCDMV